jgi:hypothetical protein
MMSLGALVKLKVDTLVHRNNQLVVLTLTVLIWNVVVPSLTPITPLME